VEVLINYESKHQRAIEIMREEAVRHPLFIDGRSVTDKMNGKEVVDVKIIALEQKGVRLRAFVWVNSDNDSFNLKFDLFKTLKERFEAEGIEIAHDDNVLEMKKE
jgi:small conductance mechanosensitive channel